MTISDGYASYPPIFRPNPNPNPNPEPCLGSVPVADPLPLIDLEKVNPEKLRQACKEWGIFRVVNHGIPVDLLKQVLDQARAFFTLTFESKQAHLTQPILYFWGSPALTKSGLVQKMGPSEQNINWLEGLNVPFQKASHFHYQDPYLETFRSLLVEYTEHQTRVAHKLFNIMAEDLNFTPTKSQTYLSPHTGFLRVYRYLRCSMADQRLGIVEHTDSSVISILHQDEVGGLQVHQNNKWLDVPPIQDALVVNLGDMMQAMSDDRYKSVKHRVRVNKHKERISLGYFVFPAEDAVIDSSKYMPFTYGDFQAKKELDLETLENKIGLPAFRLKN